MADAKPDATASRPTYFLTAESAANLAVVFAGANVKALERRMFRYLIIYLCVFAALTGTLSILLGYDETDDPANRMRSGFVIQTDYGTGVQYLVTRQGGVTPRIASDGTVMKADRGSPND
jgi:hypothetical protein